MISDTIAKWHLHKLSMKDRLIDMNADRTVLWKIMYLYESVQFPKILHRYGFVVICVIDIEIYIISDHTFYVNLFSDHFSVFSGILEID